MLSVNRSVSASYLSSYIYYIEPSNTDAFNLGTDYEDYEKGGLDGARLGLSWMTDEGWYAAGEWSRASGSLEYTGYTQGSTPAPAAGFSGATIQDYDIKLGRGFSAGETWLLTPYLSFGGRHWERLVGQDTSSAFLETYNHMFLGGGAMVQHAFSNQWVVTGDALIGRTISPKIDVPDAGLNNAALGVAPIIKLGVEADYSVSAPLHFFAAADLMYFTYGQSDVFPISSTEAVMEPLSRTETYRLAFGLRVSFL